jgi:hypothetical protein
MASGSFMNDFLWYEQSLLEPRTPGSIECEPLLQADAKPGEMEAATYLEDAEKLLETL